MLGLTFLLTWVTPLWDAAIFMEGDKHLQLPMTLTRADGLAPNTIGPLKSIMGSLETTCGQDLIYVSQPKDDVP